MSKIDKLEEVLRAQGVDEEVIAKAVETQKKQKRTHRLYKIYLNADQFAEVEKMVEGFEDENSRIELMNPRSKWKKYYDAKKEKEAKE